MNSECLLDFNWYSECVLKIQTKTDGLKPFKLKKIQKKYIEHLKRDFKNGITRSIVLKPRQSGFSTLIAGINAHQMWTKHDEKGIMLADKHGRTKEVFSIYETFRKHVPVNLLPGVHRKDIINSEEMYFESIRSGFKSETSNDPNAGRSGTRRWAHLTEFAFYRNADAIDEGIQNSIPLAKGTRIFKESTAFGISGVGASFYNQWEAAVRGESIYKPFFVSWFDVEDYALDPDNNFKITKDEKDLLKLCPNITHQNLVWRRLKLSEYASSAQQIFTPQERFKQDFPSYPEEAFLSSGFPVFDQNRLKIHIKVLNENPLKYAPIRISKTYLSMYQPLLSVYLVPEKGKKYLIGADVAEGLAFGDSSCAFIMDQDGRQVAVFHGKLDPDHFGKVLVELAQVYNDALIIPEINNMGHTTLTAIKDSGYLKVYMRSVFDEIGKVETHKMGWRTTVANKQTMLSRLIAMYRDDEIVIYDRGLLKEMIDLTRESNGDVDLNGKDRVVAACLAAMGIDQVYEAATIYNPTVKIKLQLETKDLYREKDHATRKW